MNRIVVITGSASGIGRAAKEVFTEMGDTVLGIDVHPGEYFQGDISSPSVLESFAKKVLYEYGRVDILINNALPLKKGISSCSYDQFMYALRVGVAAPFYLAKLFKDAFAPGSCIINVSSTRDSQSQAESESYAAAKGGIRALTHAMAASLGPTVRVNSISPGWIDTQNSVLEAADLLQQPAGKVGRPEDAAWLMAFLASDVACFIDGEDIKIDGGMSKRMIYHGDENWHYQPERSQLEKLARMQAAQEYPYAKRVEEEPALEEGIEETQIAAVSAEKIQPEEQIQKTEEPKPYDQAGYESVILPVSFQAKEAFADSSLSIEEEAVVEESLPAFEPAEKPEAEEAPAADLLHPSFELPSEAAAASRFSLKAPVMDQPVQIPELQERLSQAITPAPARAVISEADLAKDIEKLKVVVKETLPPKEFDQVENADLKLDSLLQSRKRKPAALAEEPDEAQPEKTAGGSASAKEMPKPVPAEENGQEAVTILLEAELQEIPAQENPSKQAPASDTEEDIPAAKPLKEPEAKPAPAPEEIEEKQDIEEDPQDLQPAPVPEPALPAEPKPKSQEISPVLEVSAAFQPAKQPLPALEPKQEPDKPAKQEAKAQPEPAPEKPAPILWRSTKVAAPNVHAKTGYQPDDQGISLSAAQIHVGRVDTETLLHFDVEK